MPRWKKRPPISRGRKWAKDVPRGVIPREVQARLRGKSKPK